MSTIAEATTNAVTAPTISAGELALDVLARIPVALEYRGDLRYDRTLFAVWLDLDGDRCDTRQHVLIEESRTPPVISPSNCEVDGGEWLSSYDGLVLVSPTAVEIDHVVSLKEAWDSGAWAWVPEQRIAFANDTTDHRTLRAVSAASNQQKGDKDPSNFLPSDPAAVCQFVADWVAIKARWSLTMDESEYGRIRNLLKGTCRDTRIE